MGKDEKHPCSSSKLDVDSSVLLHTPTEAAQMQKSYLRDLPQMLHGHLKSEQGVMKKWLSWQQHERDLVDQRRHVRVQPQGHMRLMYDVVGMKDIQIKLECFLCLFSAGSEHELAEHIAEHAGVERPYRCRKCPYAAARRCHLACHERTHMRRKLYKCSFCGYSTMHKSNVIVHERNHTGEKPYKCRFCNYRAAQKGNVTVHERKHLENSTLPEDRPESRRGELDLVPL